MNDQFPTTLSVLVLILGEVLVEGNWIMWPESVVQPEHVSPDLETQAAETKKENVGTCANE